MPRPPAVSADQLVDAAALARAGSTLERHFSAADLPRLREAGAQEGSWLDARFQFSIFDEQPAVDGTMSGTLHLRCERCMQPVPVAIEERFQVILVPEERSEEPGGYEPVIADAARLDVRWLAEEQALLALPLVPMHAVDECEEHVEAEPDAGQSGDRQKPFENLRDLLRQR
jgi:uncharacterized protein